MSLVAGQDFKHMLRFLNTNIDGRQKVMFALTAIPGIGRRFSNLICKKAEIDMSKRAAELTADEVERLIAIIQNPSVQDPQVVFKWAKDFMMASTSRSTVVMVQLRGGMTSRD